MATPTVTAEAFMIIVAIVECVCGKKRGAVDCRPLIVTSDAVKGKCG